MTRHPLVVALLVALASAPAFAQTAPTPTPDHDAAPATLDTVVVTGTRASNRTVAESLSPIDVITPEALQATGTSELATALARALPSLNFPRPAITDGTDAVRPAQLRGMAPDQVLVLVNGKRRHTTALINLNGSQGRGSSPVDLNAIPIAAVERVEVLRDGASAQYGSDAIAGVVNVVLKGSESGGIEAKYGQMSAGDGAQTNLSGDAGFRFGGERGLIHLAGQVGHNEQTDRARPVNLLATPLPNPIPPQGKVVQRYGDPEISQAALSLNGTWDFSDNLTAYVFGMASNRDALSNGFFRAPNDSRNNPAIYPNGFLPNIHNLSKDRSIVAGIRGTAADWDWDASYNYGYNYLTFKVENSLNRSMGLATPLNFYAGALEVTQNVFNFDISKPFAISAFSGPLTLAFGAEYRDEKFNQSPGEIASWVDGDGPTINTPPGAQVFPGFKPGDAGHQDRNSYSFYADAEADITEKFSAGLAARYEHYSDFGNTTTGKLSARYAFNDAIALRGTLSTGFRAPSLQQQYFQSTATNFIGGVPFDVRTFAVSDPVAIALGAEPLKQEESQSASLGLVLQPVEDLYITIDGYQIDVDDRIVLSENLIGAAVTSFLEAQGIFGVTGGRYFTNAVDTRTRGIDIVGTYRWTLDSSNIDLTASYNHTKTTIERIAPNPPELTSGGLNLNRIGRVEQGRITIGAPQDKFALIGVWNVGNWSFNAATTRYGEFTVLFDPASANRDQTFGAEWTLDLAATYNRNGWYFTVGGDNVTDEYPDEVILANSTGGQIPYSAASPFGFNGAFVYGKIGFKW
jgi:iron complex outermembrane recepter protein